ncbi:MAG: ABC transporter permease subunit [Chloroflexia bacterium]
MQVDVQKIRLILRKEWLQIRQQRGLLLSALFLPILFTVLPLGVTFAMGLAPPDSVNEIKQLLDLVKLNPALAGLSQQELLQAAIGQPISVILLILPVLLPSIIASYSVVGEKVSGTLEPVLATPVTTLELLLAKILTAFLPAVGITWVCGALYVIGMIFVTLSHGVFVAIISVSWFLLFLLCGPLLALTAVAATVAASSRANDPRTAQEISAIVILPVMLVLVGQFTGLLVLSPIFSLLLALVLAVIAAIVTWVATRLFDREAILTRWS